MKTKNFFLTMAAMTVGLALTGAMMTSCSKIDIPVADNDGNPPLPKGKTVKLDTLSADYVAQDGETLTGPLKEKYKISIANGATVTLSGVLIDGGITCLGDATIVLADNSKNNLKGKANYPGIQAGREGTTLTICGEEKGSGELVAIGGDDAAGIGSGGSCGDIKIKGGVIEATGGDNAAGIGSGSGGSCGDIKIEGGKIMAIGGDYASGIGCGFISSCGNITIESGEIEAAGGYRAAGIGTGRLGWCGNITIRKPARGTAKGGERSPNAIGAGDEGECGEISVDEDTIICVDDPIDNPNGGGPIDDPNGGVSPIM